MSEVSEQKTETIRCPLVVKDEDEDHPVIDIWFAFAAQKTWTKEVHHPLGKLSRF